MAYGDATLQSILKAVIVGAQAQDPSRRDHEQGMMALREYVLSWPGRGVEFRKQYVIVHTR